jgi:hypothetical protein
MRARKHTLPPRQAPIAQPPVPINATRKGRFSSSQSRPVANPSHARARAPNAGMCAHMPARGRRMHPCVRACPREGAECTHVCAHVLATPLWLCASVRGLVPPMRERNARLVFVRAHLEMLCRCAQSVRQALALGTRFTRLLLVSPIHAYMHACTHACTCAGGDGGILATPAPGEHPKRTAGATAQRRYAPVSSPCHACARV